MEFKEEELALLFALALSTRVNMNNEKAIEIAFDSAEFFLDEVDRRREVYRSNDEQH